MAIPSPDELYSIVKITPDTAEEFLAKLTTQMNDVVKVKNGFRQRGAFSFYIPGALRGGEMDKVRKELGTAKWNVLELRQIQGYMPSNEIIDFRNVGPTDLDVTGPSTFAWVHVQIIQLPD